MNKHKFIDDDVDDDDDDNDDDARQPFGAIVIWLCPATRKNAKMNYIMYLGCLEEPMFLGHLRIHYQTWSKDHKTNDLPVTLSIIDGVEHEVAEIWCSRNMWHIPPIHQPFTNGSFFPPRIDPQHIKTGKPMVWVPPHFRKTYGKTPISRWFAFFILFLLLIWRFPEIGVRPKSSIYRWIFHYKPSSCSYWGTLHPTIRRAPPCVEVACVTTRSRASAPGFRREE